MRVGRAHVHEHRVQRQRAGGEQRGDVRQEDRHEVGATLVDGLARVGADEQGAVVEVPGHLRRQVRAGAFTVEVRDLDVVQLGRARDKRIEQH